MNNCEASSDHRLIANFIGIFVELDYIAAEQSRVHSRLIKDDLFVS